MKKLLTILLITFSLGCFGQVNYRLYDSIYYTPPVDSFVEYEKDKWYNEATWIWIDSTSVKRPIEYLLDQYDKYANKCYRDSTKKAMSLYDVWYGTGFVKVWTDEHGRIPMESNFITDSIYYTHKEPTFTGFIEWLNK